MLLESRWECDRCGEHIPCRLSMYFKALEWANDEVIIARPTSCPTGLHVQVSFELKGIEIINDNGGGACN